MEEVREMFQKLQADLNCTNNSLKEMEANITKNININIGELFGNVQLKMQQLEEQNEAQERRIDIIERTQRQRNVVIFGVADEERDYNDLAYKVLSIINDIMNVQCTMLEIQALRRIGKRGDKTRPLVITLTTLGRKIEIQKSWKSLKNTPYSITDDYPPKILEIRKNLYEQARSERENGNRVMIKYDKLVFLPTTSSQSAVTETRNTKRTLSQTPPQAGSEGTFNEFRGATQAQKKNKITSDWNHTTRNTRSESKSTKVGQQQRQQQIIQQQ